MRDGAPDEVLAGVCGYRTEIASWLGSTLLASGIRPINGSAVWSRRRNVKDSISFEVKRLVDGVDWAPRGDMRHPLAAAGQVLEPVAIVTSVVTGIEYRTPLGRFTIEDAVPTTSGTVAVTAYGIEQREVDETIPSPLTPLDGGTFASEIRRLMPVGLSASISASLVDRPCPTYMVHSGSRFSSIEALLSAWPAIARPDGNGQLRIDPPNPTTPSPVMVLSDGERSPGNPLPIVVSAPMGSSRSEIFNRVIVNGTQTDESSKPPFQKIVSQTTGPFAVDPEGFGTKDTTVTSAAITTVEQAAAVGQAVLDASIRSAIVVPVEMASDPRLELDDPVGVRSDQLLEEITSMRTLWGVSTTFEPTGEWGQDLVGYVEGIQLPFVYDGGSMRIDVAVVPS